MSHFYGDIAGQAKTIATRRGSKSSGLKSHIRSWNVGIKVNCFYDHALKRNVFEVYRTGGSNNPNTNQLITSVIEEDII